MPAIRFALLIAMCFGVLISGSIAVQAEEARKDRHEGYYYPKPESVERWVARTDTLPDVNRSTRLGFVTGVTTQMLQLPYPATAAMFAKGAEAQKLIITALEDGRIDTIYRARAILANLTATARVLPIFQELGVQETFTFFELAKMLGFEQITITNGRDFAHQIIIE